MRAEEIIMCATCAQGVRDARAENNYVRALRTKTHMRTRVRAHKILLVACLSARSSIYDFDIV
jgi:hypothetical protein